MIFFASLFYFIASFTQTQIHTARSWITPTIPVPKVVQASYIHSHISSTPTLTPTSTPSPSPSKRIIRSILRPTRTPTPTAKLSTNATPTQTPTQSTDSVQTFIMNAINDYRKSKGLSSVKTDSHTCSFAKTRAKEISVTFNHDGFTSRIDSHTLPYPSYSEITENIAETPNYQEVVTMWINSPGHAANMQKDTPFVCVGYSGNYYAYEGWKP